ncbi:ABC transporter permease [Aquibaculum arenosum]|uniref:ABC transporter permease n=1 Tax=Aquibaculum arenosum TaxID=3032591 RepID=A0ABT5YNI7_9PROT|nr:ABC transporter permease [Fodinicurvata sp. CAU 1616]MDF2096503.1 ABC transporter permease [Fodinicurvata sp. CAU 1616]
MSRFLLQRLLESLLVLALMSFLVYLLIGLMPGDPIDIMISGDPNMSAADAERLRAVYGLDQPLLARYWAWLTSVLSGDLGYSRLFNRPVETILLPRLGNTLLLMGAALLLALIVALPLGVAAARRPGSLMDVGVNLGAFAGASLPPFWLAILLILLFAVYLGWLPAGGMGDGSLAERLRHMILPVVALSVASVAGLLRHIRAALREALRQDYVRTARAKGLSDRQVVYRHALRNAMIPVVTILALDLGMLFSGALITETVFGWLGMGKTIYDAIMGNDYNLALIGLLLATGTVLLANLLADLVYAWLDPRIEYR